MRAGEGEAVVGRDRVVVGTPETVANVVRAAHDRGTLVATSPVLHRSDGTVALKVRLLEPAPAPTAVPARSWRGQLLTAAALATVGVVGLAGYGLYLLALWVVAHATVILGAVAIAILLGLAGVRSGVACRGMHCPGCRH